jgi:hypothetical protein
MKKGFTEYITDEHIGILVNAFGRIVYINGDWPDGRYVKMKNFSLPPRVLDNCTKGRTFTKEELTLELL